MAQYYRIAGGFIAVTNEGPRKGPLKGLVLVGRGPKPGRGPETVYEQAFSIAELRRLEQVPIDDVPDPWLDAFGYDQRPAPTPPPVEEIRVNFLPEVFEPRPIPRGRERYGLIILGAILFIAAVLFFHWLKG